MCKNSLPWTIEESYRKARREGVGGSSRLVPTTKKTTLEIQRGLCSMAPTGLLSSERAAHVSMLHVLCQVDGSDIDTVVAEVVDQALYIAPQFRLRNMRGR